MQDQRQSQAGEEDEKVPRLHECDGSHTSPGRAGPLAISPDPPRNNLPGGNIVSIHLDNVLFKCDIVAGKPGG